MRVRGPHVTHADRFGQSQTGVLPQGYGTKHVTKLKHERQFRRTRLRGEKIVIPVTTSPPARSWERVAMPMSEGKYTSAR